jgi:hypothetical protein
VASDSPERTSAIVSTDGASPPPHDTAIDPESPSEAASVTAEAPGPDEFAGADAQSFQPCEDPYSALDLAGLEQGTLSRYEIRRLAKHLTQCETCRIFVAILVAERTGADGNNVQVADRRGDYTGTP